VQEVLRALHTELDSSENTLVCAACGSIGEVARTTRLPLPVGGDDDDDTSEHRATGGAGPASVAPGSVSTVTSVRGLTKRSLISKLLRLSKSTGPKGASTSTRVNEAAVHCLGLMSVGEYPHGCFEELLAGLCDTSSVKSIELQFTVGTALCCTGMGPASLAAIDRWRWRDNEVVVESAAKKARLDADAPKPRLGVAIDGILEKWARHPLAWRRQAAGIWLVSILKYCSDSPDLPPRLQRIQGSFSNLLSEGDEFAQDVASKGMGLLYDIGDSDTKAALVQVLVSTFSEGRKSTTQKFTNTSEDEVNFGEIGGVGKGQGFSTYKELCGIASDLNQPDLIYKFMAIANHNTMWNSRKGAAFGFSTIAAKAQDELKPHLPALVPKLYRYQFDPTPSVRAAMENIFKTIVPEATKTVDLYVHEILEDLLDHISDSQWRVRESSCAAIGDILRGRRWPDLRNHLHLLWSRLFRALDDVKESVRVAAASASKRIAKVTVGLCKADTGTSGEEAIGCVLPILIEEGLLSRVDGVRGLALGVMIELAKEAGPALKPHVVDFLMILLEALSGLENPVLDYVANRLDPATRHQDALDDARMNAARGSPLMDCISLALEQTSDEHLPNLVDRLCELVKKGIGSSTKSGCAFVATQLTTKFRAGLTPYANQLLKALFKGAVSKSAPLRREFANAIGHVVRIATPKDLNFVVKRCRRLYEERTAEETVEASAAVCHAIAKRSPDVLQKIASSILPVAFLGMHDTSATTRALWTELWEDNTPGIEGGVKLYADEIVALALPHVEDRSWDIKKQGAMCIAVVAERAYANTLRKDLSKTLDTLIGALHGRTWEGKESVVRSLASVCVSCAEEFERGTVDIVAVHKVLLREFSKKAADYRAVLLPMLEKFYTTFGNPPFMADLCDALLPTLVNEPPDDEAEMDKEEQVEARENREKVCAAAMDLLLAALKSNSVPEGDHLKRLWTNLSSSFDRLSWKGRVVACRSLSQILDNATKDGGGKVVLSSHIVGYLSQHVTSISAIAEESKQTSLRLAALQTVGKLVAFVTDAAEASLSHDLVARLGNLASTTADDADAQVLDAAEALKSAVASFIKLREGA